MASKNFLPRRSERNLKKKLSQDVDSHTLPETQAQLPSPDALQRSLSLNELDLLDELDFDPTPLTPDARAPTISDDVASGSRALRLFRGAKDPLSAFFHHPFRWKGNNFISAEVAYQHEKLVHHCQPHRAIGELLRSKTSQDAKRIALKWLPSPLQSWHSKKFQVMDEICKAKLMQCREFKDALQKSGDALLVHNVETDSTWGCGPDFLGDNMMGCILMDLRQKQQAIIEEYKRSFPPLSATPRARVSNKRLPSATPYVPLHGNTVVLKTPTTARSLQSQPRSEHVVMKQIESHSSPQSSPHPIPRVYVFGNSNVRGLAQGLCDRRVDATASIYPGQTIGQILNRILPLCHFMKKKKRPDAVLVHAGDIEVRDHSISVSSIAENMRQLCSELRSIFPSTRVIISGLPHVSGPTNGQLNRRISALNDFFEELSSDGDFLCIKDAKLRYDEIHLTVQAKTTLARTAAELVKPCL